MFLCQWTQDLNWTYIRRSEDVLGVFWTSYVRSIYVLCLLIGMFWILMRGRTLLIFYLFRRILQCFFVVFTISWEVRVFWIYFLHQYTWIPGRINLFQSLIKWLGKRKIVSCENNLFVQNRSTYVHNMETWQKRTPF